MFPCLCKQCLLPMHSHATMVPSIALVQTQMYYDVTSYLKQWLWLVKIIARGRNIWIIYSLVPLREGIYHSYTPLVIVQARVYIGGIYIYIYIYIYTGMSLYKLKASVTYWNWIMHVKATACLRIDNWPAKHRMAISHVAEEVGAMPCHVNTDWQQLHTTTPLGRA